MGRAFEYRKARKLKRWGNMAKTFTKIGREIAIAVKSGGLILHPIHGYVCLFKMRRLPICPRTMLNVP